jgi:hypothetical protein
MAMNYRIRRVLREERGTGTVRAVKAERERPAR